MRTLTELEHIRTALRVVRRLDKHEFRETVVTQVKSDTHR
jgi:hypothetical protein